MTLNNICNMLECTPFDVIRYVPIRNHNSFIYVVVLQMMGHGGSKPCEN